MISISEPIAVWKLTSAKKEAARLKTRQPPVSSNGSNKQQNSRLFLGCLLVAGVGFTAFCLLTRQKRAASPSHIKITDLAPEDAADLAPTTKGLLHYKNKETRNIEWNEDGLPTRMIIEREYYQLP